MDPIIKKNLEDKVCKTGGGRRIKKKKHKAFKKGFLLDKKNGLGDEFRKKLKQQQKIDACSKKLEVEDLIDPNEVLTEDDLIDISKMHFDINKDCTEACINDPNCEAKRANRIKARSDIAAAEYHNNKVKLQNRLFKNKKEERRIKNDLRIYNESKKKMTQNIRDNIKDEMKKRGMNPKDITKEDLENLAQEILKDNGIV